jgi:hypothetical protein
LKNPGQRERRSRAGVLEEQQAVALPSRIHDTAPHERKHMSLWALVWAINKAPVTDTEQWAVLVCMADAAGDDGEDTFLSIPTIAKRTMLSENVVRSRIRQMLDMGFITERPVHESGAIRIPANRRPRAFDLLLHFTARGSRGEPHGVNLTPDTQTITSSTSVGNSPSLVAAAATTMNLEILDAREPQPEDDGTGVTPRNPEIPWTVVHLLRSWFRVEDPVQVESWQQAWRTGVVVAGESYDPEAHIVTYLTRCHHEKRDPKPSLWLRFLIEDRQKHLATIRAHEDQLERQAAADGGEQWALKSLRQTPDWRGSDDASGT